MLRSEFELQLCEFVTLDKSLCLSAVPQYLHLANRRIHLFNEYLLNANSVSGTTLGMDIQM